MTAAEPSETIILLGVAGRTGVVYVPVLSKLDQTVQRTLAVKFVVHRAPVHPAFDKTDKRDGSDAVLTLRPS